MSINRTRDGWTVDGYLEVRQMEHGNGVITLLLRCQVDDFEMAVFG